MQIGSNPFIHNIHQNEANVRKKDKKNKSSMFSLSYVLDLSRKAFEYQELYKDDDYPIINSNVFSYKKNLEIEYKPFR